MMGEQTPDGAGIVSRIKGAGQAWNQQEWPDSPEYRIAVISDSSCEVRVGGGQREGVWVRGAVVTFPTAVVLSP
jgi:hypothetical protein